MQYSRQQVYKALARHFGFSEFLNAQESIVTGLLEGKSLLAIMPTGSGKSLCFQLPAMIMEGYGLVVSPMISLMKDQVMQMRQLGIPAAMHNSLQSPEEQARVRRELTDGKLKLLYMAPETLVRPQILELLEARPPSLIAIDEAHCISMWGHDFRPEYRQLSILRERFPKLPCFALTATAIPKVRDDICAQLSIPPEHQVIESFNRPNLLLAVEPKKNSFKRLIGFLSRHNGESGIIYCMTRKKVEDIANRLVLEGFRALPYHAGLSDTERHRNQEAFINDEIPIMVATIAFGMGINKSNIRFVVHLDLPKSLETYYQEIGRAGRDGLPSSCLLLYSYADVRTLNEIIYTDDETMNEITRRHLDAMLRYCKHEGCRRIPLLQWFGERYKESNCQMCDNCLADISEKMDASEQAKMFLSAIYRAQEKYPARRLIKILRGSKSKELLEAGDTKLSVWGIGKQWSEVMWFSLFHSLKKDGSLKQEYPDFNLKLTPRGWEILKSQRSFTMPVSLMEVLLKDKEEKIEDELFDQLSALRAEIASHQQVPPYVVFSDKSLREMSSLFPQSAESFTKIGGVGTFKAQRYGDVFIRLISSYCLPRGIADNTSTKTSVPSKKATIGRTVEVVDYLKGGHNLQETMVQFGIKLETLLDHLQRFLEADGWIDPDLLRSCCTLGEADAARVRNCFRQLGTEALGPVYRALNEEIGYTDLKLQRMIMVAELNPGGQNPPPADNP